MYEELFYCAKWFGFDSVHEFARHLMLSGYQKLLPTWDVVRRQEATPSTFGANTSIPSASDHAIREIGNGVH